MRSPLPDLREPDSQTWPNMDLPLQSRPPEEATGWREMEEQVNLMDREKEDNSLQTEEPEEHWDSMTLPVYPMIHPSVPLSFATVQWDITDLSPDMPYPMTDSPADELDSSGAASLDWTVSPLSHHQQQEHQACVTGINIELSVQEKTHNHNGPEQQLPLDTDQSESSPRVRQADRKGLWLCVCCHLRLCCCVFVSIFGPLFPVCMCVFVCESTREREYLG